MSTTLTAPAASSPAPVVEPRTTLLIPQEPAARAEFMKTGNMPEETKPESSTGKETPAEGAEPEGKTAPASEPGNKQETKPKNNADSRATELRGILDEFKALGASPAEIRDLVASWKQKPAAETAKAAPETTAKPEAGPKAPVKPKAEDFEGKPWSEYEAAKDKYFEDLADYKAAKAIADDRTSRQQEAATSEVKAKLEDAKSRYGAEAETTIRETSGTIFNDAKIDGVVKALVNDSPVFVDLLYVLGSKPEDLADFIDTAQKNPGAAIRKLVLVEKLVLEELAKGKPTGETARGEDGKFKTATPEKKTTAALPPPKEVDATRAAPVDEYEAALQHALKTGDARKVIDLENQRELRRRKGH